MGEVAPFLVGLAVSAAIYVLLQRRSGGRVQWRFLAAIVGCAAFALFVGALTR